MKEHSKVNIVIKEIYSGVLASLTIVYCIFVSSAVVIKARKQSTASRHPRESLFDLKTLIFRTCLYPTACFLSCIGFIVSKVCFHVGGINPSSIFAWGLLGFSTMGVLNLLAFLADPMVLKSIPILFRPSSKHSSEDSFPSREIHAGQFSYDCLVNPSEDPELPTSKTGDLIREFQAFI